MQSLERRGRIAAAVLVLLTLFAVNVAFPCGPSIPQPAFWYSYTPFDRDGFFAGDLGVLANELRAPYLYVAYRHLEGAGLDEPSRSAVEEYWQQPERDHWSFDAVRLWAEAVYEVTGERGRGSRDWRAQILLTRPDGSYGGYFTNCLEDAFRSAGDTLRARAGLVDDASDLAYAPGSAELAAWIDAQEIVFSHCGPSHAETNGDDPLPIPAPFDAGASQLARADRAYQIAAAYFYARRFDTAIARFEQIAVDRASPWSDLSAYLVARSLIRSATIGFEPRQERFSRARDVLTAILDDPSRVAVHDMARGLRQFIDIRLDPGGVRAELETRLMADDLTSPFRQHLVDYLWLIARVPREEIDSQEGLSRWLLTFGRHHDRDAGERAFRIWQAETESAGGGLDAASNGGVSPWLAASLVLSPGAEAWTRKALAAAQQALDHSPLLSTVRFHQARLERALGDIEAARSTVAASLSAFGDRLNVSDRNRFVALAAELAPTLDERIELGQLEPVAYTWDHLGGGELPLSTGPPLLQRIAGQVLPTDDAVNALNLASSAHLLRLLHEGSLDPSLERRLAPIAWTRAVLAGEEETALALAPSVAAAAPELAAELGHYSAADAGEARIFAAALAILRFPGLRPTLRHGFGRYGIGNYWEESEPARLDEFSYLRDNWWCSDPLHGIGPEALATLNESSRAEAGETIGWLRNLPPAPTYLGYIVLARAETHRDDPRVPEALHRVVRGGRVCGGGDISRIAFQTLHRRYPGSEWTRKTPYWYR